MLTNVALPSRAGEECEESGLDSLARRVKPRHRQHFVNFPYKVSYKFNSRGFRDHEWPEDDQLKDAIWCIGDSFTLGIGSAFEHSWPQVLQRRSGQRTINVSMDGASNEWIAKMALQILDAVAPVNMVIMWSYLHRRHGQINCQREDQLTQGSDAYWKSFYNRLRLPHWPEAPSLDDFHQLPEYIRREFRDIHVQDWLKVSQDLTCAWISDDLSRRIHSEMTRNQEDVENTKQCVTKVMANQGSTRILQAIIPDFAAPRFVPEILDFLSQQTPCVKYLDRPLDWARDYHHFDIKTSEHIVDQLLSLMS